MEKALQSITAGGFLYIATVSVLPELLSQGEVSHIRSRSQMPTCQEEAAAFARPKNAGATISLMRGLLSLWQKPSAWQTVRELTGIMGGIGIMALVTLLEGSEHHH